MSKLLVLLLLSTAGVKSGLAQAADPCSPPVEVRAALEALPVRSILETTWEFRQKRLAALEDLRRRFPDEMFIERAYYGMAQQTDWEKVNRELKGRYEQKPDDPRIAFLYGLNLEGRRSVEAIKVLEGALAKSPEYPWPHRPLYRIYDSPAFLNRERAMAHAKAGVEACPNDVSAYQPLATVDDKAVLSPYAVQLRGVLEKRTDAESLPGYQTLWSLCRI